METPATTRGPNEPFAPQIGWQQWGFASNQRRESPFDGPRRCQIEPLHNFTSQPIYETGPIDFRGRVYVPVSDNQTVCYDTVTRTVEWTVEAQAEMPALSADETLVYIAGTLGDVRAHDVDTGDVVWSFLTTDGQPIFAPLTVANGQLFVAGSDGFLYVLDGASGALLWKVTLPSGSFFSAPMVDVENERVYVGAFDKAVHAYDIGSNGTVTGAYVTGDDVYSTPALAEDGHDIYFGSNDFHFYRVRFTKSTDGQTLIAQQIWNASLSSNIYSSPAVDALTGDVFISENCGNIHSFSAVGETRWSAYLGDRLFSSPSLSGSLVYLGANDTLFAMNKDDGAYAWTYKHTGWMSSSPVLSAQGTLFVGTTDGQLVAFPSFGGGGVDGCTEYVGVHNPGSPSRRGRVIGGVLAAFLVLVVGVVVLVVVVVRSRRNRPDKTFYTSLE